MRKQDLSCCPCHCASVWCEARWGGVPLDLRHFNHMPFFLFIVPAFSPTSSQLKQSIFVQSVTLLLASAPSSPPLCSVLCSAFCGTSHLARPQQHSPWQTTSRSIKHREDFSCWLPVRRARRERHAAHQASTSRLWLVVNKQRREGWTADKLWATFSFPASRRADVLLSNFCHCPCDPADQMPFHSFPDCPCCLSGLPSHLWPHPVNHTHTSGFRFQNRICCNLTHSVTRSFSDNAQLLPCYSCYLFFLQYIVCILCAV